MRHLINTDTWLCPYVLRSYQRGLSVFIDQNDICEVSYGDLKIYFRFHLAPLLKIK